MKSTHTRESDHSGNVPMVTAQGQEGALGFLPESGSEAPPIGVWLSVCNGR